MGQDCRLSMYSELLSSLLLPKSPLTYPEGLTRNHCETLWEIRTLESSRTTQIVNNRMFIQCWHHEECGVEHLRGRASLWCSHQRAIESTSTTCSPLIVHQGDEGVGWCCELRYTALPRTNTASSYSCTEYLRHHPGHNNNVLPLSPSIYTRKLISSTQEQKNESTHILIVWSYTRLATSSPTLHLVRVSRKGRS